jgi:hypothetical protein
MAKIKGWKKKVVDNRRTEWFSEEGGYHLQIKKQDSSYLVTYGSLNNYRRFKTKKEAINSAINYMRRHPNG